MSHAGLIDRRTPHRDEFHWWRDRARCAEAPIELVDEAFRRPGGPSGKTFRETFCHECPVLEECKAEALTIGEWGIWGATSTNGRTKLGGKKPTYSRERIA